ncbi:magnesium transporter CorA family protein [Alcaligenes faecalis]|uniref:magnesium transporter CorA family protein n=1 Tax=Alcaligenes faecalis TaxID=511 RepID=UPI001C9B5A01|nr:CorA family divalent cation transporter [Alcaligenes faecalis]MBY6309603.1 magnesium transporter [Alcaligenes faecalis]MBY6318400.1 magnesium transporter [Alcaligenes faecalis]MBY6392482.1 magnesium transporter [Alcaligenes faecalis]
MTDQGKTPPLFGNDGQSNNWMRISIHATEQIGGLRKKLGVEIPQTLQNSPTQEGHFSFVPVTFLNVDKGLKKTSRVVFILSRETLVSIEPDPSPKPLAQALQRLQRDGRENDAFESFAVILQSINDAADELLDALSHDLGKVLTQTNAVLNSLETKDRDFGVSDVVSTQMDLSEVEELLSDCLESQLQLAMAARHALARLPADQEKLKPVFHTLIDDIEAVEKQVNFVHDRVRLLQTTNNMALNVKQNQIVKVFSVVTAVFLPAMLISTYYSMNFAYMPILQWEHAEMVGIISTALFSMLPLIYVKHRGWLR